MFMPADDGETRAIDATREVIGLARASAAEKWYVTASDHGDVAQI